MMKYMIYVATALLSLLATASCDKTIHEYPYEASLTLTVRCTANLDHPAHYVTVECDSEEGVSYVVRTQNLEHSDIQHTAPTRLRYIVDLYRERQSHAIFVERKVLFADIDTPAPQAIASFEVSAERYKVLVWCDYVLDDAEESWCYITDDLLNVRYADVPILDNNDKEAFSSVASVDLAKYSHACHDQNIVLDMTLERPNGRYKCIATDAEEFIASNGSMTEDITAVITYVEYVSAGYNVEEQKPNYFEPTRTYVAKAEIDDSGDMVLCYDYVLVNGKQSNVKLNMTFYRGDVTMDDSGEVVGDKISQWYGVIAPLKRNMETIIEGRLLTTSFGSGSVGIDPGFEGEIVIPWGD